MGQQTPDFSYVGPTSQSNPAISHKSYICTISNFTLEMVLRLTAGLNMHIKYSYSINFIRW